jgi:hypothetical protein
MSGVTEAQKWYPNTKFARKIIEELTEKISLDFFNGLS